MKPARAADVGNKWTRLVGAGIVFLVVLMHATVPHAQSATGSIEGRVVDASGAVLPGVTVSMIHAASAAARTVVTDEDGAFRAPLLPVGAYELVAVVAGFETYRRLNLLLTIGQAMVLRIELQIAGVAQEVMVTGENPVLERTRTAVTTANSGSHRNKRR
jgi:hypothetical protein